VMSLGFLDLDISLVLNDSMDSNIDVVTAISLTCPPSPLASSNQRPVCSLD
jgi:hypothetical protein